MQHFNISFEIKITQKSRCDTSIYWGFENLGRPTYNLYINIKDIFYNLVIIVLIFAKPEIGSQHLKKKRFKLILMQKF